MITQGFHFAFLFALMQKETKRSRLQEKRLKFIAFRYREDANARHCTRYRRRLISTTVESPTSSLLYTPCNKFLNALFLRPIKTSLINLYNNLKQLFVNASMPKCRSPQLYKCLIEMPTGNAKHS